MDTTADRLKGKVVYTVGILILIGILGLGFLFYYWMSHVYDPIEIKNPVKILSRDIHSGDFVLIDVDYCKTVAVHRIIHINLVSQFTKLPLPDIEGISKYGCYHVQVPFPIPKQAPTGTYHLEFKAEYDVNPVRKVMDGFDSEEFHVTNSLLPNL